MRIYVGNLNYDTTEDALRDLFAQYGDVAEVAVITDRDTGRPRGFAFVTMPDASQGRASIEALNGADLDGRALNVNEARPKGDRDSGGPRRSGGGGGGGGYGDRRPGGGGGGGGGGDRGGRGGGRERW
ncbi:MAG: RNA-binding protein [Armatimonadetes bacterium]|nr:RNA-binding protein [Armatimonadota bacterium]